LGADWNDSSPCATNVSIEDTIFIFICSVLRLDKFRIDLLIVIALDEFIIIDNRGNHKEIGVDILTADKYLYIFDWFNFKEVVLWLTTIEEHIGRYFSYTIEQGYLLVYFLHNKVEILLWLGFGRKSDFDTASG